MSGEELGRIQSNAWESLERAVDDTDSPYRLLTLASLGKNACPQARLLVLRRVDSASRCLEFHTDTRSPKWQELGDHPEASVLGFDPGERVQLRMAGTTRLFGPGSSTQQGAWSHLGAWTRSTYCGGPPGDALAAEQVPQEQVSPPTEADLAPGERRFGVIIFGAMTLDWYQLKRGHNRRAQFRYQACTEDYESAWVAP